MTSRIQWERELSNPAMLRVLAFSDFFCLQAFWTLYQVELDFLSLIQAAISIALNCPEVDENIVGPIGHRDKTKALGIVEPLYGSCLAI